MPSNDFYSRFKKCQAATQQYGVCLASVLKKHKKAILIISVILGFILFSTYYYIHHIKPKLKKTYVDNKEFVSEGFDPLPATGSNDEAVLYFFYTDWCPHSQTAKPIMTNFKNKTTGGINGIKVIHKHIDCDKEPEFADKFDVKGYPSIKLQYKSKVYDYDAKPDVNTLSQFLQQTIVT